MVKEVAIDEGNGIDIAFFIVCGLFYLSFSMMDGPNIGQILLQRCHRALCEFCLCVFVFARVTVIMCAYECVYVCV